MDLVCAILLSLIFRKLQSYDFLHNQSPFLHERSYGNKLLQDKRLLTVGTETFFQTYIFRLPNASCLLSDCFFN